MTPEELQSVLNLHTIRRWQIVEMTRDQSVVEHAFRVWALALDLYDHLFTVEHNSFERDSIGRLALLHDIDEVITGDIPSTVKAFLDTLSSGITAKMKETIMAKHFPTLGASLRGMERTFGYLIVKIADNVEAMLYLEQYGREGVNRDKVYDSRLEFINMTLEHAEKTYTSINWTAGRQWATKVLGISLL